MSTELSESEQSGEIVYDDPRYRRSRPVQAKPYEKDTSQEDLVVKYAPRIRWICWVGLLASLAFAVDYFLPYNTVEVKVEKMIKQRRGNTRPYYVIFTDIGRIKLYNDKSWYFSKEATVNVKRSVILKTIMSVERMDGTNKIQAGYVYSATVVFPLALFIVSVLGLMRWRTSEFPFNLAIVTALLLIVNVVLLW